ncbi:asparagine synthase-related protein [Saccharomonospora azurea]|uniref:asparagine synthase-related protein n=1 Tax=Saccharomonospora azurea TaxID=40988 RepID=UPI00331C25B0
MDLDVVRLTLRLSARWSSAATTRGVALRKAFGGWLPEALLWRSKAQFGQGTGAGRPRRALRRHRTVRGVRCRTWPPGSAAALARRTDLLPAVRTRTRGREPKHLVRRFLGW